MTREEKQKCKYARWNAIIALSLVSIPILTDQGNKGSNYFFLLIAWVGVLNLASVCRKFEKREPTDPEPSEPLAPIDGDLDPFELSTRNPRSESSPQSPP